MEEINVTDIHNGERMAILNAIKEQAGELHGKDTLELTCPCGASGPIQEMFQCLYCEVHFCPNCAKEHFGN